MLTSLQFVPKVGNTTDGRAGYVFAFIHHDEVSNPERTTGQEVWILDGENLAAGPVAKMGHPEMDIGITLHSTWTPTLARRQSVYQVDLLAAYEPLLKKADAQVRDSFKAVVAQHFS